MKIRCAHCETDWDLPTQMCPELLDCFLAPGHGISAEKVKKVRELLGLPMMQAKLLLLHRVGIDGCCVNCSETLITNRRRISICGQCHTLNIDGESGA
jgi:hypothetical protein